MIIIIPLGGKGMRFKDNGYKRPKALIRVKGRPILYYLLDSLNIEGIDFISIPYHKEYCDYHFELQLQKDYPNHKFLFHQLSVDTQGAAESINAALKCFDESIFDKPILCLDGDNFYKVNIVNLWNGENKIFTFDDSDEQGGEHLYSYITINDNNNLVTDIIEKVKVSNNACTGAYGFDSFKNLLKYTQNIINQKTKQRGEYYTSTVIREMINDSHIFKYQQINSDEYICLGTPLHVRLFQNKTPFKALRFCFDIDNTLVTYPLIHNDYTSVQPIPKMIDLLKRLKQLGHYIILYTARRMKTNGGNIGKVTADVAKITFATLDKLKIPYDEIFFGKPYADFYIDDLAVNRFDNLEKELGFYDDSIQPRDFNRVEFEPGAVIKSSANMEGEIFYYKNIPTQLTHFFPKLIDYDLIDSKWLKIERITGLTVTNLYLSELLTTEMLKKIMHSIHEIHSTCTSSDVSDVFYLNYCSKLSSRYHNYDYSYLPNADITFKEILAWLTKYSADKNATIGVIHGDPVMTNILITTNDRIKFIDMRGKQGSELSIYGDVLYDWAKLYQSLIGYDKILQNGNIKTEYELNMIDTFKTFFLSKFSTKDYINMCWITKSLLFSLIPLHDNDKCKQYYDLISKVII